MSRAVRDFPGVCGRREDISSRSEACAGSTAPGGATQFRKFLEKVRWADVVSATTYATNRSGPIRHSRASDVEQAFAVVFG